MFDATVRGGMPPQVAYDSFRALAGEAAARSVLAQYEQKVGLTGDKVQGWYAGPRQDDRFWPALKQSMVEQMGSTRDAVQAIDAATSELLSLMQPPQLGSVNTRDLVFGYAQSDRPAHYTALMAKAADVGYRLFIVLADVDDGLRRQAKKRLRDGLVALNDKHWATLTSLEEDSRTCVAGSTNASLANPSHLKILCVIKKRARGLDRLLSWLRAGEPFLLASCPVLIIDAEAGPTDSPAAGQRQLHDIMGSLPRVAYIGYAATPLARVLVDPSGGELRGTEYFRR